MGGCPIGRTTVRPYTRSLTLAARLVGEGEPPLATVPLLPTVGRGARRWGAAPISTMSVGYASHR
jgi:hypothetical protein